MKHKKEERPAGEKGAGIGILEAKMAALDELLEEIKTVAGRAQLLTRRIEKTEEAARHIKDEVTAIINGEARRSNDIDP